MPLSIKILEFLLSIIFNLFCMLTIVRLYMQLAKVSFANPIGQIVIKLTNWLVLPLQRILPKLKRFDLPTFVAAYLCSFLHTILLVLIGFWAIYGNQLFTAQAFAYIAWGATLNLAKLFIHMLSAIIIIQVILSWIRPSSPSAWFAFMFTQQMSAPLINPIKKRLPLIAGLDFSPFVALLLLQLMIIIINHFMP